MEFDELVNRNINSLPLDQGRSKYFNNYVEGILKRHLSDIKNVNQFPNVPEINSNRDFIISTQENVVDNLKAVFRAYFDGSPSTAYKHLSEAIRGKEKYFDELFKRHIYKVGENFYRVRLLEDNYQLEPRDLFHMPFELRGRVMTQRYSIAGIHSLYLGRTIYVCWEELGRPKLDAFHAIRFNNTKKIKLIDLTPPEKPDNKSKLAFLLTWPFIALSSIKVKYSDHNFKPEYILPQLLLEWVKSNSDVDGIRFISTKINFSSSFPPGEIYNIVLPSKQISNSGHCKELTNMFRATNPTSLHINEIIKGGISYGYLKSELSYLDDKLPNLEIVKGIRAPYSVSRLGRLELILDHDSVREI